MPCWLTHILTRSFLALVEDSLHPSAFRNLLSLTSPRGPTLLSLSSSSPPSLTVALRSRWALFFSHFSFPPPSIHIHHILLLSVIFVSLLFSAICPPPSSSLAEFNPKACCGLLCGVSTQSQSPGFGSAVTPSLSFSPLSVLACRVCLSAAPLMDLSVAGFTAHSALAHVTRHDLHLIRGSR